MKRVLSHCPISLLPCIVYLFSTNKSGIKMRTEGRHGMRKDCDKNACPYYSLAESDNQLFLTNVAISAHVSSPLLDSRKSQMSIIHVVGSFKIKTLLPRGKVVHDLHNQDLVLPPPRPAHTQNIYESMGCV